MAYHSLKRSDSPPHPSLPDFTDDFDGGPEKTEQMYGENLPSYSREPGSGKSMTSSLIDDGYYVADKDAFLKDVYAYHQNHGLVCSILSELTKILTYSIVVFLILFLSLFIDYDAILDSDETTNFWDDIVSIPEGFHPAYVFFLSLALYPAGALAYFFLTLRQKLRLWDFFKNRLEISEEELQNLPWNCVAARVTKIRGLCEENETELDLVNRIMRHDNFFIALVNRGDVLDFELSWVPTGHREVTCRFATEFFHMAYSWVIERCLWRGCLIIPDVAESRRNPEIQKKLASRLNFWFLAIGISTLLLLPFTLVFVTARLILEYGNEIRNNPSMLGLRTWSVYAKWLFREFNELSHLFEARLGRGVAPANRYLQEFQSHSLSVVGQLFSFVFGSLLVVIIFLSLWSDSILSNVEFAPEKSGIWVVGVLGVGFAVSRALVFVSDTAFDPEKYLLEVATHTHYMPKRWRNDPKKSGKTKAEFVQLFPDRLTSLVTEIVSVVIVPFLIAFRLPCCTEKIVRFYSQYAVNDENLGDVLIYSKFPMKSHGDSEFGAESENASPVDKLKEGKLEASFTGFYQHYPEWQPDQDGKMTLERMALQAEQAGIQKSSVDVFSSRGGEEYDGALDRSVNMGELHQSFFHSRKQQV